MQRECVRSVSDASLACPGRPAISQWCRSVFICLDRRSTSTQRPRSRQTRWPICPRLYPEPGCCGLLVRLTRHRQHLWTWDWMGDEVGRRWIRRNRRSLLADNDRTEENLTEKNFTVQGAIELYRGSTGNVPLHNRMSICSKRATGEKFSWRQRVNDIQRTFRFQRFGLYLRLSPAIASFATPPTPLFAISDTTTRVFQGYA